MAFASSPGSIDLQSKLQNLQMTIGGTLVVASSVITDFLKNPSSQAAWNNMNTIIQAFLSTYGPLLPGLRVLVSLSDGRVAYDSSRGADNTFANYQSNTLGENHNTRIAIMTALLGNSGIGNERKYSTTTNQLEYYNAVRMGFSPDNSYGCTRVSVLEL